jgi:hypothetical protein
VNAYLQLLLNLVSAQVAHWHARLALDSSGSHVPSQHSNEDCQGQQGPVPPRDHIDAQLDYVPRILGGEGCDTLQGPGCHLAEVWPPLIADKTLAPSAESSPKVLEVAPGDFCDTTPTPPLPYPYDLQKAVKMGRELQKKKNKSGIPKKRQNGKSKKKLLQNPIIAQHWYDSPAHLHICAVTDLVVGTKKRPSPKITAVSASPHASTTQRAAPKKQSPSSASTMRNPRAPTPPPTAPPTP